MTTHKIELLTAAQAAEILHVSPWRVTEACRAGRLRASRPGKAWLIEPDALRDYLAAHSNVPEESKPLPKRRRRRRAI